MFVLAFMIACYYFLSLAIAQEMEWSKQYAEAIRRQNTPGRGEIQTK